MKTKLYLLISLLFIGVTLRAQTSEDHSKAGKIKYDREDYKGALRDYNKAIEVNPSSEDNYYFRGNIFNYLGRNEEAIKDYTKAIALDPNDHYNYSARGRAYDALGRNREALQDFNKAIEVNPSYENNYYSRGNVFNNLGRNEEAIKDYTKAIALDPNDHYNYSARGRAYDALGRNREALQDFNKAIEVNPSYENGYYFRGNVFNNLGRNEEAIKDYTKAIALDPNDHYNYSARGRAYDALGRNKEAREDYSQAIRLKPDDALARTNLEKVKGKLTNQRTPKIWIVAVGIDNYESKQLSPLRSSVANAYRFKDIFKSANLAEEDQIEVLSNENADKESILAALQTKLCNPTKVYPEDMIIFYFVGHGVALGADNSYGICPHDYRGLGKLISEQEILAKLNTSRARHKFCLMEACKSKNLPMGATVSSQALARYNDLRKSYSSTTVILTSAKVGEISWELDKSGGVFSRYLLLGIKGKADGYGSGKKDNVVSTQELYQYVKDNVMQQTGNDQEPQINKMAYEANIPIIPVIEN